MTKILVTGATGHLGGLVVKHLLDSQKISPSDIVAGSRKPEKATELAARGVEVRKVDFDDPATLASAFSGIDRLLIVSTDEVGTPGKRLSQHKVAVEAAAKAGVKRIYYTSLPDADTSPVSFAPDHFGTEEAIRASGIPYTILRNGWYMENLFFALPSALKSGSWYTSEGDGKTAYIARKDIARATAAALANPPAESVIHTLTGDRAYSKSEIAALVSQATGKALNVVQISDEDLKSGMVAAGLPEPVAVTFTSFDQAVRAGKLGQTTGEAQKLAGGSLVSLEDFIKNNAAAFNG